ncbi:MAG: hypothetical protein DLM67_07600 [Candidatus Nephthysia bennettiae]|nr:MAG: hypothetical protein DLM67_07600 [Candidatus Dormibacteraeota bacterium]
MGSRGAAAARSESRPLWRPPELGGPGSGTSGGGESPLRLPNLLNDAGTLAELLVGEAGSAAWLDAFLLAAGLDQSLEDALHSDPAALGRIAARLRDGGAGPAARGAAAAAESARAGLWAVRTRRAGASRLARCHRLAAELAADLADLVVGGEAAGEQPRPDLQERAARLRQELDRLPRTLKTTPLRLPSAFLHLDTGPEDLQSIIAEVAERWPDRDRSVVVVGVRTAGSYLAPLGAACLRAAGRRDVRHLTVRPGQRWLPAERRALAEATAEDALVLIMDDPPKTWATVVRTARALMAQGIRRTSIVAALQTFPATAPPPTSLAALSMVLMPAERQHIHEALRPQAVKAALQDLLDGDEVVRGVTRLPFDPHPGARAHVGALFEVRLSTDAGRPKNRLVYAQGAGLGYFGSQALAVSQRLEPFLPRVYGVRNRLLFRDWLPEELRLGLGERSDAVARAIVDYVSARARALPVGVDVSQRLRARPSLWRAVGRFLAQPFGRFQVMCWPLFEAGTRNLLQVSRPSVVDGRTGLANWFRQGPEVQTLRKIGFADGAFSAFDTYCYDPVFDLAGVAASSEREELRESLLRLYTAQTGMVVEPERWLLYQLVHLSGHDIEAELRDPEMERRMSGRLQRYFSELLLADFRGASRGMLCGIDVDGVLESTPLGITAPGLQGTRALRALHAHGYRPLIVSGRSLGEVRERCQNYRAAGGVAEYGAAIYVTAEDRPIELVTRAERRLLDSLRSSMESLPGVVVDRAYDLAVRAYRLDSGGWRRGLREEQVEAALAGVEGTGIRAIRGHAQTDFMADRLTKATGLEALADQLGVETEEPAWLAMAIGDTASDLPMLRLARLAFAPANADAGVREAGITVLKNAFQGGLTEATARLLGHRPGSCPACRDPALPDRSRLLLTLLSPPAQPSLPAKAGWAARALLGLGLQLWNPLARTGRGPAGAGLGGVDSGRSEQRA